MGTKMNGQLIGVSSAKAEYEPKYYNTITAEKKPMTFKQRVRNWLNSDINPNTSGANKVQGLQLEPARADEIASEQAIRFKVIKARGGTIIETQMYNRRKDTSGIGLYVIHDDMDLGTEISKIITIEALKAS
jgi:hypothetical protein